MGIGKEKDDIPLSLEDINNLVPGMCGWTVCSNESDENYYDTMFLTSDITRMSPDIVGSTHQNNILGRIGVEYDNNEIDDDEEEQKRIPINWCKYDNAHSTWPCDISSQDSTDSKSCEYMMIDVMKLFSIVHLRTWVFEVVMKGMYFSLTDNMKEWSRMMMGI